MAFEHPIHIKILLYKKMYSPSQRLLGMPLEAFCEIASDSSKKEQGIYYVLLFHGMAYIQRALPADPHGAITYFRKKW